MSEKQRTVIEIVADHLRANGFDGLVMPAMSEDVQPLTPSTMKRGGQYNWKGQPDRLIYLGRNWSGNGFWHQFQKIGDPREVWCEVLDADLPMLEETKHE